MKLIKSPLKIQLRISTLSDKSDKLVRFDLFERLNTGGVKLTDQEIRNCIFCLRNLLHYAQMRLYHIYMQKI